MPDDTTICDMYVLSIANKITCHTCTLYILMWAKWMTDFIALSFQYCLHCLKKLSKTYVSQKYHLTSIIPSIPVYAYASNDNNPCYY